MGCVFHRSRIIIAQMGYDVEDTACKPVISTLPRVTANDHLFRIAVRTWLKGHMAAGNDIYGQPPAGAAAATAAAAGGATGGSAS